MEILIIQTLRMGDALQLMPVIKGIKTLFSDSRITLLTSTLGVSVLKDLEEIDSLHILNKERILEYLARGGREEILSALEQLQSDISPLTDKQWDWIINLSFTFYSALLSFLLEGKHRSGLYVNKDRQYVSKDRWFAYSLASFVNRSYSNFSWVDINKNMVGIDSAPCFPLLRPQRAMLQEAAGFFEKKKIDDKPIVGLHPGASSIDKMWPEERFVSLGRALVDKHGKQVIIFGGEEEKLLGERLRDRIGGGAFNLAGATDLEQLKTYLALCDVLVTNDTGPMHLAAAVGTRTVGLFFCTHFIETGPYGAGHVAICPAISCFPCQGTAKCPDKKCRQYISPDTVEFVVTRQNNPDRIRTADFPPEDAGKVDVFLSSFDPWGNLQWRPLSRKALNLHDIEQLAVKTSWLYFTDMLRETNGTETRFLKDTIDHFDRPNDGNHLNVETAAYLQRLSRFKNLLGAARSTSIAIQTAILKNPQADDTIKKLGRRFEEIEEEIRSFDRNSSISFLSELSNVFLEHVEKTDTLSLSIKTASIYRSMEAITDGVMKRTRQILDILQEQAQHS